MTRTHMPRHLGPGGGTQLPRHMGPPGPKIGGDPHACDTGSYFGRSAAKYMTATVLPGSDGQAC